MSIIDDLVREDSSSHGRREEKYQAAWAASASAGSEANRTRDPNDHMRAAQAHEYSASIATRGKSDHLAAAAHHRNEAGQRTPEDMQRHRRGEQLAEKAEKATQKAVASGSEKDHDMAARAHNSAARQFEKAGSSREAVLHNMAVGKHLDRETSGWDAWHEKMGDRK